MTVLEFARNNGVTSQAVYKKIKRGIIPCVIDKDGCRQIPDGTMWAIGRSGRKAGQNNISAKDHARNVCKNIDAEGNHKHHWSYSKDNCKDVILIKPGCHKRFHSLLKPDKTGMFFMTTAGDPLDTKEKHIEYYNLMASKHDLLPLPKEAAHA